MKFKMSERLCVPKTPHDVHKELCKKPDLGRSIYEVLGPNDKYRDENYEIYLAKCEEFKMKGKKIQEANMKALTTNRPKLGEMYKIILEDANLDNEDPQIQLKKSEEKVNSLTSLASLSNVRETGVAIRKRHERYYKDTWDTNDKHCYFEPWFRRYLILCRFISAARRIIQKHRMLKRLAIFKELKLNKELIIEYESQYIKLEQLSYPNVFEKFIEK